MKFGQFMSYCQRQKFMKKFYKNCDLKTSSRPFCVCKELSITSNWKVKCLRQAICIRYVLAKLSKFVQISTLTSQDFFLQKNKKGQEVVSRQHFSQNFLIVFFCNITQLAKFHQQTVYFSSYSVKCVSCFMLRDLMTS